MINKLKIVFYSSIIIFIILLSYFFIPFPSPVKRILIPFIFFLGFVFLLLGIILLFLSKKQEKKLKTFLILTGISAILPFISSILHNVFYALAIKFEIIEFIFEILSSFFFILSIIISPILFIIGIIGCFILFKKKN